MCGIAAIWGAAEVPAVQEMLDRVAHRGPDAQGIYADPEGAGVLGNRRLAIIDLAGGDQPILGPNARSAIVANCEMYNYRELRSELSGQPFRTSSDTETALHLYREFGTESASMLDGMYAYAVADGGDICVARDPLGIKPLYMAEQEGVQYFASEQKSLSGFVDHIEEFPPGTFYHSAEGFRRYYEVPPVAEPDGYLSLDDAVREVREKLEAAVVKRLVADVPVGALLSGGVDSSAVAAIARRHVDELHTFSVGLPGSLDFEAARTVARHIDSIHHEYVVTPGEIRESLPDILYHLETYDAPTVHSSSAMYFVSRFAAEFLKVVLVGEGADELFAGYPFYESVPLDQLNDMLRESVASLHNLSLQRVDRMTMAHSLEARVPFLDVDLVAVAQRIDPRHKLMATTGGARIEKWVLRKAVEDLLPPGITWRKKDGFDQSTRADEFFADGLDYWMSDRDAEEYRAERPFADLRSHEEAVFHKLMEDAYVEPDAVLRDIGRWSNVLKW